MLKILFMLWSILDNCRLSELGFCDPVRALFGHGSPTCSLHSILKIVFMAVSLTYFLNVVIIRHFNVKNKIKGKIKPTTECEICNSICTH